MTKTNGRGVKFLLTRVATGASAVAMFVSLWAGVAAASQKPSSTDSTDAVAASDTPIEQDGWRWDPKKNDWVAIEQPAAATAAPAAVPEQVVVIERQPIYYYTYVQAPQPSGATAPAAASSQAPKAAGSAPANAAGTTAAPTGGASAP